MTVDILICTYNEGILECDKILLKRDKDIRYTISHQLTDDNYERIPNSLLNRSDVDVYQIKSKGLSANRNNALKHAKGDICIIADDDVEYNIEDIKNLIYLYENNKSTDIIVGKIRTFDNEQEYKKYSCSPCFIRKKSVGSVSSIEISFRRNRVIENGIKFDTRFGLGGLMYPKGEECIFLNDCLKQNLIIKYFPFYMVKHPRLSSTSNIVYNAKEAEYYGALTYRMFSNYAYLLMILFAVRHYKRYIKNISIIGFLRHFYNGIVLSKEM